MMDSGLLMIIAMAGVCFGFLVGYIIRGLFRQSEKPDKSSAAELETEEISPAQEKSSDQNWCEVAHLWRDRNDGSFIFQVGDKYHKSGSEVAAKERIALLKIIQEFNLWLDPASAAAPEAIPEPAEIPQAISTGSVASLRSDTVPRNALNGFSSTTTINPANMISNALRADVSVATSPALNMVTQVDEILQEKLNLAKMQKWAIRLTEFPNKGMVVLVGLEQYEGIDEVPYERVRKIIRESVQEWERRVDALTAKQDA